MSEVINNMKTKKKYTEKYKPDMDSGRMCSNRIIEAGHLCSNGVWGKQSPIIIAVTNKEIP